MQEIFNRYINYLTAERNASPYTIRNYRNDLVGNYKQGEAKGFFQFLLEKGVPTLADVDKNTIRDYMGWLVERGVAKVSIARKLSAIRSFYRYLVREEILPKSPIPLTRHMGNRLAAFSLKLDKRLPEFLTVAEMQQFLSMPDPATPTGRRDRALLEIIYASGVRVSEASNLDMENLKLDSREIRIVSGKGAKDRMALIGGPAKAALELYLADGRSLLLNRQKSPAVFIDEYDGQRLPVRKIQRLVHKYPAAAGILKKVHPHMLRHSFATHLLDGGADLKVVQELLGHAKLSSTEIYTHISQKRVRQIYLSAHPMARKENDADSQPVK